MGEGQESAGYCAIRYSQWRSSKHIKTSAYSCDVGLHMKSLVDASVRNFNRMVLCFPLKGSRCRSRSRVSKSVHAYEKDIQLYGKVGGSFYNMFDAKLFMDRL